MTVGILPSPVGRDLSEAVRVIRLAGLPAASAADLAEHLYLRWYLGVDPDGPQPGERNASAPSPASHNLVDALRAADAATAVWEDGWTVAAVSSKGRLGVARDGQRRVLHRIDTLPSERPCLPPAVGASVRVTARREHHDPNGFWFTFGGHWDETAETIDVVRWYWNAPLASLPPVVGAITRALRGAGVQYALKAAAVPELAVRPDSAVLYLRRSDATAALPALRVAHRQVVSLLDDGTPPLARRLGPGLAVAEDPGTGESFGQHRCRLVAEGLALDLSVEGAVGGLVAAGIDPARPHLSAGRVEEHPWSPG